MKIVIHPQYEYLTDFIHRLPTFFEKEGTTIYDGRNRIKVFQVDGLLLNVKRFRKPILINRLIYSLLRAPKAKRSYEYALRLREKGIDTPEPIAYILCEEKGLLSWSYFISFQMPETYHTLYEAGQGPIEENSELFRALGTYTAHLHQKGIYHKDYSPGNILYHQEPDGIHFSLIDINRMSFGKVSLTQGCANFARIWGGEQAFHILAESYAKTLGAETALCQKWIFHYRQRFWKHYARKHSIPFNMD